MLAEISSEISSAIKGYHFYLKSLDFGKILECVLDLSQVINPQVRIVINKSTGDMTGQIPEILAKILAPEMVQKKQYCHWKLSQGASTNLSPLEDFGS